MSIDLTTQTVQYKAQYVKSDDTTTNGGEITSTLVVDATRGEWFPKLEANPTGTLYASGDQKKQYQKTFIGHNDPTLTLTDASVYVVNGVKDPASPGFISLQSNNAADSNLYEGLFYCDVAGAMNSNVHVGLNGVALVTGSTVVNRIFRGKLRNATTGALYDPVGLITVRIDGEICGYFMPEVGWITSEVKIALTATTSDVSDSSGESGTATNRLTSPAGISTYYQAYLPANALPVRNDTADDSLLPNICQPVWGEMILEPATPTDPDVKILLGLKGVTA